LPLSGGTNAGTWWLVQPEAEMPERQLYHSENGDRWFLCRDDDGRVSILHKANVS
jgi:hypothetical protein